MRTTLRSIGECQPPRPLPPPLPAAAPRRPLCGAPAPQLSSCRSQTAQRRTKSSAVNSRPRRPSLIACPSPAIPSLVGSASIGRIVCLEDKRWPVGTATTSRVVFRRRPPTPMGSLLQVCPPVGVGSPPCLPGGQRTVRAGAGDVFGAARREGRSWSPPPGTRRANTRACPERSEGVASPRPGAFPRIIPGLAMAQEKAAEAGAAAGWGASTGCSRRSSALTQRGSKWLPLPSRMICNASSCESATR